MTEASVASPLVLAAAIETATEFEAFVIECKSWRGARVELRPIRLKGLIAALLLAAAVCVCHVALGLMDVLGRDSPTSIGR